MLFLSGENPGERKCQQKAFRSMRDYLDLCEKSSPVKESSLVLNDVDNSFPATGEEDWLDVKPIDRCKGIKGNVD